MLGSLSVITAGRPVQDVTGVVDLMRLRSCVWLAAALALASPALGDSLLGFPDPAAQRQLEQAYRMGLNADDQARWARELARKPHHPGSEHGQFNIEYVAAQFAEWGFDVAVETFDILLPVPVTRELSLIEPEPFSAGLMEDVVAGDASSADRALSSSSTACSVSLVSAPRAMRSSTSA